MNKCNEEGWSNQTGEVKSPNNSNPNVTQFLRYYSCILYTQQLCYHQIAYFALK